MTAGLGRPLILTTLQPSEAMRVLAAGRRMPVAVAGILLIGGLALLAASVVALLARV